MNSQGYTKDNIHKGNTKIVAGGIDVDGLIRIGDQSTGGNGYVLPESKGTEGQVLTMNADNTTSFQDSGGIDGRIIKNLGFMIDSNSTYNTDPNNAQNLYSAIYGSLNLGSIDNFFVGSTIHIYSRGKLNNNATLAGAGTFQLNINSGGVLYESTIGSNSGTSSNDFYHIDITIQRIGTNDYKFNGYGLYSDGNTGQKRMVWPETNLIPTTPFTTFDIDLKYYYISPSVPPQDISPIAQVFYANHIFDTAFSVSPPPAPTSHLALTDLTAGDGGHSQFAQLNGRNGGQILSGGITPLHNLTLKSHDIGLPNLIVRDLNTTFEKDIDMNQKQINNCLVINNQAGQPLNLIGGSNVSAVLLDATPTQGVIIGSNVGTSTEISGESQLDLSSNSGSINVIPSTLFNVIVGGLPRLGIDATEVNIGNPLNMNNNLITNTTQLNNGSSASLNLNGTLGIELIEQDPLKQVKLGTFDGITDSNLRTLATSTQFDKPIEMNANLNDNSGGLNTIGNGILFWGDVRSTKLTGDGLYEKTTGSQSLALNTGDIGVLKNINMNSNAIFGVGSINGFTPAGGVFMGTSDGVVISATTTETTLLPATFVGTLTIPPNAFQISSFHLVLAGSFASNNGDDLTVRLRSNGVVLGDIVVPLNNSTASNYEVEVDFQIRAIGGTGVADILTNFDFTYNQSGGGGAFVGERNVSRNNTTFDTTIVNTLAVTAQFSSASANNSIQTRVSKLSQTY